MDFQELHLIMSASPCRADLFASQSQEASGEKMQSSFSRSHTSLTKTRQTPNHIHISDAAVTTENQVQDFSPSFLAFFPSSHSYSTVKVAHSWKWITLLLGAFPTFGVFPRGIFWETLFSSEETKRQTNRKEALSYCKNTQRREDRTTEWAPQLLCHDLKRWSSFCHPFSWHACGWKCKSG